MSLEKDDEYFQVGKICARLLFTHVENEVRKISEQEGRPLSSLLLLDGGCIILFREPLIRKLCKTI